MSDYIPTTSEIRGSFIRTHHNSGISDASAVRQSRGEFFDRWYSAARDDARRAGARQALLDYADLLDGPTYTMNYGSADGYREQVLGLLRRDADLLYGPISSSLETP